VLLRESGKFHDTPVDMAVLADTARDSGVPDGGALLDFCNALTGTDRAALDAARTALKNRMGPNALFEASVTAANFSMLDRIANSIGIPMEGPFLDGSADFRVSTGINNYLSARNTLSANS